MHRKHLELNTRQSLDSKGTAKFYFMNYSCVVIILFKTDLCKSGFSNYSFNMLVFYFYLFFRI